MNRKFSILILLISLVLFLFINCNINTAYPKTYLKEAPKVYCSDSVFIMKTVY